MSSFKYIYYDERTNALRVRVPGTKSISVSLQKYPHATAFKEATDARDFILKYKKGK